MAQPGSTVDLVIEDILSGISGGRYVPEQRLITTEFAERLGTSLSPVREAFHVLAGEGVLEIVRNRGARVRRLTVQDMIHGFEVLAVVGPLALRKFAPRLDEPAVQKQLGLLQADIVAAADERHPAKLFAAVARSHRYVNEMTGNPYIDAVVDRLHLETFYRQVSEYIPAGQWDRFLRNYQRTFEALAADDLKRAERELRRHFEWCISLLEKRLADNGAG